MRSENGSEFNEFDDAMRRILSVSREELKRRQRKWKRERKLKKHAKS
jgi:hypothetical protein